MIIPHNKTVTRTLILISSLLIIISITWGFKGDGKNAGETIAVRDSIYNIQSYKLPDSVFFAGEKMPLENFDTR